MSRARGLAPPEAFASGRPYPERADPKWILPLICRLGGLNKSDVGAIRIFPTETSVEIRAAHADAFAEAVANLPPHEPKITRADGPPPSRPFHRKPSAAKRQRQAG